MTQKSNSAKIISIYTDGACSGNPGVGGWGVVINFSDGTTQELGGRNPDTTNNQMELAGAIAGLEFWHQNHTDPIATVQLFTDSKYAIDGITKWIKGWKQNNWKTSAKQPVKNKELWQELDRLNSDRVSWHWVQGHSGDRDNERCDEIARNEIVRKDISPKGIKEVNPKKLVQKNLDRIDRPDKLESSNLNKNVLGQSVEELLAKLKFDLNGLIPAIAQDAHDGTVLMMAWMNAEAIALTLQTGEVHYWSRSRKELWHKGATSGHTQKARQFYYDCDADAVLIKIDQTGDIACHTGVRSCFFNEVKIPNLNS
jgi:ribonuclease HI/phosphoribosyl-AMP cyclohydrolase